MNQHRFFLLYDCENRQAALFSLNKTQTAFIFLATVISRYTRGLKQRYIFHVRFPP